MSYKLPRAIARTFSPCPKATTVATLAIASCVSMHAARSVSISSYGAIPNDGVDDTAAFQTALDWANNTTEDRKIYCAAGTYIVGDLTIGDKTHLLGATIVDGSPVTRLQRNGSATGHLLSNKSHGAGNNGNSNIRIRRIEFDGELRGKRCISLYNCNNVIIEDCVVRRSPKFGCKIVADKLSTNFLVQRCIFEDNLVRGLGTTVDFASKGMQEGVVVQPNQVVEAGLIKDVRIKYCISRNNNDSGYGLWGVTDVLYLECEAHNNGQNPDAKHGSGFGNDGNVDVTYRRCIATGNANHGFTGSPNGDYFFADGSSVIRNNSGYTFEECEASDNGINGFVANGMSDEHGLGYGVRFLGCTSTGNGGNGIRIAAVHDATPRDNEILGAFISDNHGDGVLIQGGTNINIEKWNSEKTVILNNGTSLSSTNKGVRVNSQSTSYLGTVNSSNVSVKDCVIGNTDTNGNGYQKLAIAFGTGSSGSIATGNTLSSRGSTNEIYNTDSSATISSNSEVNYIDSTMY